MSSTTSRVQVVRVDEQHVEALAGFYRRVWDPGATPETVSAGRAAASVANCVVPGEPPPTWIVLQDGAAIAHVTTIPIRIALTGREQPAYWVKGLWVLPEHQRSSAGFLVLRAATAALSPALGLVHEPSAIRLFQALGYTDLGGLPNFIRILRPSVVLSRLEVNALGLGNIPSWMRAAVRLGRATAPLTGALARAGSTLWSAVATGPLGKLSTTIDEELDPDGVDRLWAAIRREIANGPVRDAAALAARYEPRLGYRFVHVRSGGRLVGLGVVKAPGEHGDSRLRGLAIASLSDLSYLPSDPAAGLAVLRGAEDVARRMGADALLASASAAGVAPLPQRRAFLRVPANLHVLARLGSGALPSSQIADWWFTRGDSGGDGSF